MHNPVDLVMTEHAAWIHSPDGARRVFNHDGGRWLATVRDGELTFTVLSGSPQVKPATDTFTAPLSMERVPELATALRKLGTVTRFRNADLWEAIGTSIIRQVIRAGQSKTLYRAFCRGHGEQIALPCGTTYSLFPTPEAVHGLSDMQFSPLGMAFKRRALRTAAEAYLRQGEAWQEHASTPLVAELQAVPHIGPWTARATVADWSNDWSLYPYEDLAVRTWARRAAPSHDWPADEAAFGKAWKELAGEHLGSLTLLTLAWGSHQEIGLA